MTRLYALRGDITSFPDAEVIVNAGNESLCGCFTPGHQCLDHQIHEKAGPGLTEECQHVMRGTLAKPAQCIVTDAYDLPNRYIVHAYGPNCHVPQQSAARQRLLAETYSNALDAAVAVDAKSIAFPTISTGLYGYPKDKAARVALTAVLRWLDSHPSALDDIYFLLYDEEDAQVYGDLFKRDTT